VVVVGDNDGDGFAGTDAGGLDCDDDNAAIFPDALEDPDNGADDDCDGTTDEAVTLTGVAPSNGLAAGGTIVILTGTEFTDVTEVTVAGATAEFDIESDTEIEIVIPAGTAGARDVVVGHALSSATATGGFTYTGTAHGLTDGVLQGAATATTSPGVPSDPYTASVEGPGTAGSGQASGIVAEVGLGPQGFLPTDPPDSWSWFAASYVGDDGNTDQYSGPVTPPTFGTYSVAFRFSNDAGINWLYVDTNASTSLDALEMNQLEVVP